MKDIENQKILTPNKRKPYTRRRSIDPVKEMTDDLKLAILITDTENPTSGKENIDKDIFDKLTASGHDVKQASIGPTHWKFVTLMCKYFNIEGLGGLKNVDNGCEKAFSVLIDKNGVLDIRKVSNAIWVDYCLTVQKNSEKRKKEEMQTTLKQNQ